MDLKNIRTAGLSTTARGWLTNPIRRLLWKFVAPYFAESLAESAKHANWAVSQVERSLFAKASKPTKDSIAIANRLGSLEDELASYGEVQGALRDEALELRSTMALIQQRLDLLTEARASIPK
jgi:hypothetical protein